MRYIFGQFKPVHAFRKHEVTTEGEITTDGVHNCILFSCGIDLTRS